MTTRAVDELGRVVLPSEYRQKLEIEEGSLLDITCRNGTLILRPSNRERLCTVCEQKKEEDLLVLNKKVRICHDCLKKIMDTVESR